MISFLDKEILTESDINDLIANQIEESINLDFKAGAALAFNDKTKAEIAKDVSAFANSAGGYLIYGLSEKNHKADAISPFDGSIYTKEWFEQILQTRIQRKIEGLIIKPVRIGNDITQSIYIIQIPESKAAPHMTSDKKFYKRYNFESVFMEEYEIRSLYNRKDKTELIFHSMFSIKPKEQFNDDIVFSKEFLFQVENVGKVIEKDYKLIVEIHGLRDYSYSHGRQYNVSHSRGDNNETFLSFMGVSTIFPSEILTIGSFSLGISLKEKEYLSENGKMRCILHYSNGVDTFPVERFPKMLFDSDEALNN